MYDNYVLHNIFLKYLYFILLILYNVHELTNYHFYSLLSMYQFFSNNFLANLLIMLCSFMLVKIKKVNWCIFLCIS